MSKNLKKYLVHLSGLILGPYSKKDVENLIKDGNISINDEVIEPCSPAIYLKDHPEFKTLVHVRYVKNKLYDFSTNISGKLQSITHKIDKSHSGQTLTSPDQVASDNKTITQTASGNEDVQQATDANFQLMEELVPENLSSKYKRSHESASIVKRKVHFIMHKIWLFIAIAFVFIFGFVFIKEFVYKYQTKRTLIKHIETRGVHLYEAGNYESALVIFQKGFKNHILNEGQKQILLNLFIQQRDLEQAETLLYQIQNSLPKSQSLLIQALLEFHKTSYTSAQSLFLQVKEEHQDISLMNLILLDLVQKNYSGVLDKSNQMISKGNKRGVIFYLKSLALLKLNVENQKIKKFIKKSLKETPEYYQEFHLLLAYLSILEGNTQEAKKWIINILDWDHGFYRQYRYSSLIPVNLVNWSLLMPYCEKIFSKKVDDYLFTALYGLCHLKGDSKKGFEYIAKAKNQNPKNDLIVSLFAYSLMQQGSFVKAEVLLNQIKTSSFKIFYVLKAKLFERQKEWNLALAYWEDLLEMEPYHLSALAGLAFNYYKLNDHSNMTSYKNRGLEIYPYYVQMLSLP